MKLPWVGRDLYEQALHDKRVAEDRLYAAWKEGYQIPPRATVEPEAPKVIELLPDEVRRYVENWESPEVRRELEAEARKMIFDLGMTEERVVALFTERQGGEMVA